MYETSKLELYLAHRTALIDYAVPIVGSRPRAEDVVQEAWLRFAAAGERESGPIQQPVGYLYRIVRNLAVDWVRRVAAESSGDVLDQMAADAPSPEQHALYRDELRVVERALAELPQRTRIAFEMHRFGNRTLTDIARHLGISVGLVHQLVREAVTHCANRLDL